MEQQTTTPDLTCSELLELVTAYLDQALPARERRQLDRHLAGCEGCRAYVDQIRSVRLLARRVTPRELCAETRDDLLDAFREWRALSA